MRSDRELRLTHFARDARREVRLALIENFPTKLDRLMSSDLKRLALALLIAAQDMDRTQFSARSGRTVKRTIPWGHEL